MSAVHGLRLHLNLIGGLAGAGGASVSPAIPFVARGFIAGPISNFTKVDTTNQHYSRCRGAGSRVTWLDSARTIAVMPSDLFSVPIFFIIFRECLEASIIVSVLLAFINKSMQASVLPSDNTSVQKNEFLRKKLTRQVWLGAGIGLFICFIIGGGFIGAFYALQKDLWGKSEELWEGIFSLIATSLITVMGIAMLRINKLKSKWTDKLAASYENRESHAAASMSRWGKTQEWSRKYSMFVLPFITVLREGLEAVVFVGGVGLSTPAKAIPIPVITGLICGGLIGLIIYRGNRYMSIEYFLIASTWILYLVAAGLFSKSAGYFETYRWNKMTGGDASENGSGAGSYNIHWTIWHVNFGNPEVKDSGYGYQIWNAILGWNNTGTYATTLCYIFYWLAISVALAVMRYRETHPETPSAKIPKSPLMMARNTLQRTYMRYLMYQR